MQSNSAGIQEAWNVSSDVSIQPGTYQLYGTLTPPIYGALHCPGSHGSGSPGPAILDQNFLNIVTFNIVNDGFTGNGGCALVQVGTATSGAIGIQQAGAGSGVSGAHADTGHISDWSISGFYNGFVGLGAGGSFDTDRLQVNTSVVDNIILNGVQGYWRDTLSIKAGNAATPGTGNGLTLNYCSTPACGVGPFIEGLAELRELRLGRVCQ